MERSDEDLVEDVRAGDRLAYGILVRRHQARVIGLAHRYLRDAALAEDLSQEVFVRAYRSLGRFESGRRFGPWLMAIAANRVRDHAKVRTRRNEVTFEVEALGATETSPVEQAAARQMLTRLEAGIGDLPEETREILRLRFMDGLDYEEVAEALSLPLGTIKSRISRARTALRKVLGDVV